MVGWDGGRLYKYVETVTGLQGCLFESLPGALRFFGSTSVQPRKGKNRAAAEDEEA